MRTSLGLIVILGSGAALVARAATPKLAGHWTLDAPHSEMPADIGFGLMVDVPVTGEDRQTSTGRGGRGGGASSQSGATLLAHEDELTLKVLGDLVDEASHPWPSVTIDVTPSLVSISNGHDTRRFHPGKSDDQQLADGGVGAHSRWDKDTFVVDYEPEKNRTVRYIYSRTSETGPLSVTVTFLDHGRGTPIHRLYDPAIE
jgi:hypothetical protein